MLQIEIRDAVKKIVGVWREGNILDRINVIFSKRDKKAGAAKKPQKVEITKPMEVDLPQVDIEAMAGSGQEITAPAEVEKPVEKESLNQG